tara:strand:+ start:477 stop:647 length:171 start_codon:yes stop_codon:yes gene_type:complete
MSYKEYCKLLKEATEIIEEVEGAQVPPGITVDPALMHLEYLTNRVKLNNRYTHVTK